MPTAACLRDWCLTTGEQARAGWRAEWPILEVKVNGMVGLSRLIEIIVYIQYLRRPKGHAPSVWPLRDGPFVCWPFRVLALS